ncbi:MAG: tetratricopeptide repeat protein [Deltaproteobacteria bacterium]|nr:tetratricopeptide repeat protein [Deltaproteobacteria bacterium]MBW2253628.1 tetratricopeptide repeat protein [Deltaproteobacteria bacterium]
MPPLDCCDDPQPTWKSRREQDRLADVFLCAGCGHVHTTESHLAPIFFPEPGRCLNCGGALEPDTLIEGEPSPRGFQCERCGLHDKDSMELHRTLADQVVPDSTLLDAALVALEQGRLVLALKLASARVREDYTDTEARAIRLQTLEAVGYGESAAREAWRWAQDKDAPDVVWTILADLEASTGNMEGALKALQRGLRRTPNDREMWLEYAEMLLAVDERQTALDAAAHGLPTESLRPRALAVITEVAERFVRGEEGEKIESAVAIAGDFALTHPPLVYLRAKAAAQREQLEQAIHWLERTLQLVPDHEEARAALERIKPEEKKRWLFW